MANGTNTVAGVDVGMVDKQRQILTSVLTGRSMSWLSDLPFSISRDVPAWQLTHWYRTAASQGWVIIQQDIFDRMANPISHGGL